MPKRREETAVQRLKRRIAERIDADRDRPQGFRYTQAALAERIGITKATLNELLNGPASSRGLLAHLDKIAAYFNVPPSLLVHQNDTALMELRPEEYRLVTHWRRWPPEAQQAMMALFDYVAGLLPDEREEREWWIKIRKIKRPEDRRLLEDYIERLLQAQRTAARSARALESPPATEQPTGPAFPAARQGKRA